MKTIGIGLRIAQTGASLSHQSTMQMQSGKQMDGFTFSQLSLLKLLFL